MDFCRGDKHVALSDLSIYHTQKNIQKSYGDNKFKTIETTWDKELELPGGFHSVSD